MCLQDRMGEDKRATRSLYIVGAAWLCQPKPRSCIPRSVTVSHCPRPASTRPLTNPDKTEESSHVELDLTSYPGFYTGRRTLLLRRSESFRLSTIARVTRT